MKYVFSMLAMTLAVLPQVSSAQNFLVGIPGVENPSGNFDAYIQAIYAMFISLAALLAVVKIVIAGVKYMFTDIVPQKTQAKSDIKAALLGLVIVLSAVLILTVINPDLTRFEVDTNRVNLPAPIPDQENGLTNNDLERIQNYCTENNGNCSITTCDTTSAEFGDFLKGVPGAGFIFEWADTAGDRAKCALACDYKGGKMEGEECYAPADQEEFNKRIVAEIIESEFGMCRNGTCESVDCSFWRLTSCETECNNKEGIHVDLGLGTPEQCILPTLSTLSDTEIADLISSEKVSGDTYIIPCDGGDCTLKDCADNHAFTIKSNVEISPQGFPTGNRLSYLECVVP